MAGYSGTPLARKLGIKDGTRLLPIGAPKGYLQALAPLPATVKVVGRLGPSTTIVQLFETRQDELRNILGRLRQRIAPETAVWVSWPKKASGVPTDITENVIRSIALPLGFVDVKVCAVDDVWSGLKLVIRKELR